MKNVLRALLILSVFMLYSQTVFSSEEEPNATEPPDENSVTDVIETPESKFQDRELLIQTLLGDQEADGEVPDVNNPDDPAPEVPQPTEEQATAFVEKLSDEQVVAFNRSLNNAVKSGLPMEYDMELLEKAVEDNYDGRQINALAKALEENAKFMALYEKTGNEKFQERAKSQKEKFLAKIEKFQGPGDSDDPQTGDLQDMANASAKATAKDMAQKAARNSAKQAAHEAAKDNMKEVVRATKKETVKEKQAEKKAARDAAKAAKGKPSKAEKVKPAKPEKPAKAEKVKPTKPEKVKPENAGKK